MNDMNNEKTRRLSPRGGLLAAVAAVAAAGLLQGCGGGGGGGGSCADTAIKVSWHLVQTGMGEVQCLPGDHVTVVVDDSASVDFDCSDYSDVTPNVEGGVTHNISFTLSDGSNTTLSQTSDMGLSVACGGVTVAPEVEFDLN